MTQELIDLRNYIMAGRDREALEIVDDLEWMSKKATLRNIKSYPIRMISFDQKPSRATLDEFLGCLYRLLRD